VLEARLAHDLQRLFGRVLRRNLEAAADVAAQDLLHVFVQALVALLVVALDEEVVADARAHKCPLDLGIAIDLAQQVRHGLVAGV